MKYLSLGQQKVLFLLALLILALIYYEFYYRPASPPEETYHEVVVEILGEVQKPGIRIFKSPPTLQEVIEKAGGMKNNASFDHTSSTEILETGTQVSISTEIQHPPFSKALTPPPFSKGGQGGVTQNIVKIKLGRLEPRKLLAFSIPLDLNRVSVEDLCLIPGIGESLAQEIIIYRQRRRGFRSVEELKNVKGIEEKKYRSFKPFLTVRP